MDACYRKIDEQNQIINGLQTKLQGNTALDEAVKIATEIDSLENDPNLFKEQLLEKHKIEISDIQSSEMEIHDEKTEIEKSGSSISKAETLKKKLPITTASSKKTPRFELPDVKFPKRIKTNDGKPRGEGWAFNDQFGLINDLIRRFFPNFHYDWLVNTGSARAAVILVDMWKDIPFFAILILAALQFIPGEIYEAAKIDGSGPIRTFFSVTLPNIAKTLLSQCIFFILWRITSFDLVYAMTSGGPGDSTTLLSYRIMLEAFNNLNPGYASAISVILFILMAIVAGINLTALKKIGNK